MTGKGYYIFLKDEALVVVLNQVKAHKRKNTLGCEHFSSGSLWWKLSSFPFCCLGFAPAKELLQVWKDWLVIRRFGGPSGGSGELEGQFSQSNPHNSIQGRWGCMQWQGKEQDWGLRAQSLPVFWASTLTRCHKHAVRHNCATETAVLTSS